jgi:hypothetical protein
MITRDDIADLYIQLESGIKEMTAIEAVRALLLKSLAPGQQIAYSLLLAEESISSLTLRERFDWKLNYAGNILKSLERLGLAAGWWAASSGVKEYRLPPGGIPNVRSR